MRGRVDLSEGLIRERPTYQTTPNLIQKPDYNTALIKTFRILERSPTPTLGDVIHPVCIVEDLRQAIRGTGVRTISAQRVVTNVGSFPVLYVRCAPKGPTVLAGDAPGSPARLIVDRVLFSSTVAVNMSFSPCIHISDEGITVIGSETRAAIAAGTSQRGGAPFPATAHPVSGFTAECYTNQATVFASVANGGCIVRATGTTQIIEGPFELAPDFCCTMSFPIAAGAGFEVFAMFQCREFPS